MALDKLVDSTQLDADLTSVANAIRAKGGTSADLAFPADFVSAVQAIPSVSSERLAKDLIASSFSVFHSEGLTYLGAMRYFTWLTTIVFPNLSSMNTGTGQCLSGNTGLTKCDFGPVKTIAGGCFNGDSKLTVLILRRPSAITTLASINAFSNTPFASGKAGGTLYVPSALISNYQSATNWSTILGYANNSIQPIEGSVYENAYADGTPIS